MLTRGALTCGGFTTLSAHEDALRENPLDLVVADVVLGDANRSNRR